MMNDEQLKFLMSDELFKCPHLSEIDKKVAYEVYHKKQTYSQVSRIIGRTRTTVAMVLKRIKSKLECMFFPQSVDTPMELLLCDQKTKVYMMRLKWHEFNCIRDLEGKNILKLSKLRNMSIDGLNLVNNLMNKFGTSLDLIFIENKRPVLPICSCCGQKIRKSNSL